MGFKQIQETENLNPKAEEVARITERRNLIVVLIEQTTYDNASLDKPVGKHYDADHPNIQKELNI